MRYFGLQAKQKLLWWHSWLEIATVFGSSGNLFITSWFTNYKFDVRSPYSALQNVGRKISPPLSQININFQPWLGFMHVTITAFLFAEILAPRLGLSLGVSSSFSHAAAPPWAMIPGSTLISFSLVKLHLKQCPDDRPKWWNYWNWIWISSRPPTAEKFNFRCRVLKNGHLATPAAGWPRVCLMSVACML